MQKFDIEKTFLGYVNIASIFNVILTDFENANI